MARSRRSDTSTVTTAEADAARAPAFDQRREIELRAYYRYWERGCSPGGDVDDWLAAEQEVLAERSSNGTERET